MKAARFPLNQLLWLQAVLDGEMPGCQARQPAKVLTNGVKAQLLLKELKLVKSAFAIGEPERRLCQSRERYFKEIERAIKSLETRRGMTGEKASNPQK